MKFNEILAEAEATRDSIYGIGGKNWQVFGDELVDTSEQERQESEYRKLKRIKAENTESYRNQMDQAGQFEYNNNRDENALYAAEQTFVGAMIKAGVMDEITEDDLLD